MRCKTERAVQGMGQGRAWWRATEMAVAGTAWARGASGGGGWWQGEACRERKRMTCADRGEISAAAERSRDESKRAQRVSSDAGSRVRAEHVPGEGLLKSAQSWQGRLLGTPLPYAMSEILGQTPPERLQPTLEPCL